MGLILDTSALVAWERAQNAELTLVLDDAEERVMPAVEWQRSWPVCVWPIPVTPTASHMRREAPEMRNLLSIFDQSLLPYGLHSQMRRSQS